MQYAVVRDALEWGSIAAAATALGAVVAWPARRAGARMHDALLGFGAGVMLAASMFSLLLPSIEAAQKAGATPLAAALQAALSVLVGAAMVWLLDRLMPHEHFVKGPEGRGMAPVGVAGARPASAITLRRVWLFVGAIAIHNVPEGFAIGVGAAGLAPAEAAGLATGIAIQDIPEGGVVTLSLLSVGYALRTAIWVSVITGLAEPLAAAVGAAFVANVPWLLPAALALAGGAMLYVVSHEIIPESHRDDRGARATAGLMVGFVLMMVLDVALG